MLIVAPVSINSLTEWSPIPTVQAGAFEFLTANKYSSLVSDSAACSGSRDCSVLISDWTVLTCSDFVSRFLSWQHFSKLECGTWYHHPRRLQCVLSRNMRIFKVATWHYRCPHNLKNNCIWDNLQYCLLVPRSSSKPVMLTIDLQSRKVLFIEIVFLHV